MQQAFYAPVVGLDFAELQRPAAVSHPGARLELARSQWHELAAPRTSGAAERPDTAFAPAVMGQTHAVEGIERIARRIGLTQSRLEHDDAQGV